jgi:hypothetical protein
VRQTVALHDLGHRQQCRLSSEIIADGQVEQQ